MTRSGSRRDMAHQGHYAGALSRLLAWGADLLIIIAVGTVTVALVQFAINVATPWNADLKHAHILILVCEFIWGAFYLGATWILFGRSPGMSIFGLRIVRSDGSDLDQRHALIRLFAFPLGFLTCGVGFLGIIFSRTHQAIYDRIARTAVVYDWDAEAARIRNLAARGARRRQTRVEVPAEP